MPEPSREAAPHSPPTAGTDAADALKIPPFPELELYEPWTLAEDKVQHTLHVAGESEHADDRNGGSEERPLATIQAAVDMAFRLGKNDEGVRILIQPGTYRETVDIVEWNHDAPLVLEGVASATQKVILSGSDVFQQWRPAEDAAGQFEHAWTLRWGPEPNPWPGLMPMKEGASFRRELLFVNRGPYRQVFGANQMEAGTYWIDEEHGRVLLQPEAGVDPRRDRVEISVRPVPKAGAHSKLIRVSGSRNIALRNLVLQHAATLSFNSGALQILGTQNLLVEDCGFVHNNGVGLSLGTQRNQTPTNVILRRIHANSNGTTGLEGSMRNGLIEDSETNRNNWRGAALGATGWAPCGFKLSGLRRVLVRNHQANENQASGGWFDDHIAHVTVESFTAINNLRSGISLEAVDGPVRLSGLRMMGNSSGLNLFDSVNIHIDGALIVNQRERAVRIAGSLPLTEDELMTFPEGWRRERLRKRRPPRDIWITNSVLGHSEPSSKTALYSFGMRENAYALPDGTPSLDLLFSSLHLAGNTYGMAGSETPDGFRNGLNHGITLAEWQKLTRGDQDAVWDNERIRRGVLTLRESGGYPSRLPAEIPAPRAATMADELEL